MSDQDKFRIELRDNNGTLITYIHNIVDKVSWEWLRIGGCGAARFTLKTDFDSDIAQQLQEDYEIRIYLPGASDSELWYTGYLDKITPAISGNDEVIDISCLGYINQLKRVIVRELYTQGEISLIAKNIIETYVTAITRVTSSASNYTETAFSADNLYFDEDAFSIITKLAEIAGKREWGVDENKAFFFKARNDSITKYYHITEDFTSFKPQADFNPMITRIHLVGSEGYRQIFTVTNKVTTREAIVSNSSIVTQSVGQQFGRMFLKEHGIIKRSYQGALKDRTSRIETIPMGKRAVNLKIGINNLYDAASSLYDTGLKYDGGTESFQVEKISYALTDLGVIATLNFGPLPSGLIDELGKLNYLINNERTRI
ncbi:hypothetical protein A2V80_00835 [Candidatus Woesebacteria bacterium RBG_16_39_8b]|uniref:Prophage tail endopeptidase domain-containing protein n=1 Tax=Candidatus Woesebacteria bacterium RBG_16_39_8b TaxID=1802482 RepID=A0A1F7XBZ3_9BACT|nr:MAG: hypothetical protein A2V80_00835 [Candidatus Woesebacteria bacterium RBG_16_39_8b]